MAQASSIEWTDTTWNCVVGCRRVSPGCEHCYAETMAGRLARMGQSRYLDVVKLDEKGRPRGRWNGTFREVPEVLAAPLGWRKPRRVFVNSMSDLFGEGVSDEWIAAVFGVMAACPQHTFQILTKRPERMAAWFEWAERHPYMDGSPDGGPIAALAKAICETNAPLPDRTFGGDGDEGVAISRALDVDWPLPNVWIGTSVENQEAADERIPHLLRVPAAVRFLSVEPLLGPVNLVCFDGAIEWVGAGGERGGRVESNMQGNVDWVIVGGESGHGARPCDLAWIRSIVAQCKAAGVAVFVKQVGARPVMQHPMEIGALVDARCADRKGGDMAEWPEDLRVRELPGAERAS